MTPKLLLFVLLGIFLIKMDCNVHKLSHVTERCLTFIFHSKLLDKYMTFKALGMIILKIDKY